MGVRFNTVFRLDKGQVVKYRGTVLALYFLGNLPAICPKAIDGVFSHLFYFFWRRQTFPDLRNCRFNRCRLL